MTERDRSIDVARLAAAFLIVLYHAGESYSLTGGPPVWGREPWMMVGSFSLWGRVPFFFFLSGCFACRSLEKPDLNVWSFLAGRLKALVIPYLFWNCVCLFMLFMAIRGGASFMEEQTLTPWTAVMKLTGIGMFPANGPLWFIRDLIIVSCLAPLLHRMGPWLFVPCIALTVLPEISQDLIRSGYPRPSSLGFFGLGMLLNYVPKGTFRRLFPRAGWGVLLCMSLGVIHIIWELPPPRIGGIAVGAMGILLTGCFIHESWPRIGDWLARHANASFIVFAANVPFFAVARRTYSHVQGHIPMLAYFAILAVVFFFLAVGFHHLIRTRLPALLPILSGGR